MAGPTLRLHDSNLDKCHRCGTPALADAILHRASAGYSFWLCNACHAKAKHPPAPAKHPEADHLGPLLNQVMDLRRDVEFGAEPEDVARRIQVIVEQHAPNAGAIPALAMAFNRRALLDTFVPKPPDATWHQRCLAALERG